MTARAVMPRLELGDPMLRLRSKKLTKEEILSEEIQELIASMYYTLKRSGGVGIAAPQVGISKQLSVVNIRPSKYHPMQKKNVRFVMINPRIISFSAKKTKMHEGCLSFLDLFGEVERPSQVDVEYRNQKGELIKKRLHGLHAKVFQHEYDHLHGEVWIDKATNTKSFMTKKHYLLMKMREAAK